GAIRVVVRGPTLRGGSGGSPGGRMKPGRFVTRNPPVFRCLRCSRVRPLTDIVVRCDCGGLLEVRHPLGEFRASAAEWKRRFESRWRAREDPLASGVWRYQELVLPGIPAEAIVSLREGSTRLPRSEILEREIGVATLFIKHEGENPTLSFKDRGMTAGVSWARRLGIGRVACASTGDT